MGRDSSPLLFGSAQNLNISLCLLWAHTELSVCSTQTSVFTPAYGSVTNVRVNSTMTTQQVLTLLLNKFRVRVTTREQPYQGAGAAGKTGGYWD